MTGSTVNKHKGLYNGYYIMIESFTKSCNVGCLNRMVEIYWIVATERKTSDFFVMIQARPNVAQIALRALTL